MKKIKYKVLLVLIVQVLFSINTNAQQIDTVYFPQVSSDSISVHVSVSHNYNMGFIDYSSNVYNDTIDLSICFWTGMSAVITHFDTVINIPISSNINDYVFILKTYLSVFSDSCVNGVVIDSTSLLIDTQIGIKENDVGKIISIYPNPSKEKLYINNPQNVIIYSASMTDISGREIFSKKGYVENIQVDHFPHGVYFVKLVTDKGIFIKKIMIE